MKDRAFLVEIRKRLAVLEKQQETLNRDVESVRGVLAMLERNIANEMQGPGYRTHADLVGDFVVELLSVHGQLHRKALFEKAREGGLFFGDDKEADRQLAGFSAILSKDTRVVSSGKKDGMWKLSTSELSDLYCSGGAVPESGRYSESSFGASMFNCFERFGGKDRELSSLNGDGSTLPADSTVCSR